MNKATRMRNPGRWHVASRVFAALIPGYLLANSVSVFLGLLMPVSKPESVAAATLASFAVYTAIIMWVFSVRRLSTVWLGILGALVLTAGGSWLLIGMGGA